MNTLVYWVLVWLASCNDIFTLLSLLYFQLLSSLKKCLFFHLGFHVVVDHDLLVSDGVAAEVGDRSTLSLGRL